MHPAAPPLRSNPFCTRFVRPGAIEYRFLGESNDLDSICDALEQHQGGAIVGPHGSGKSTLLESMMPRLKRRYRSVDCIQLCHPGSSHRPVSSHRPASSHWIERVAHGRRCRDSVARTWQRLGLGDLLVVDGWEQLSIFDRLRWAPRLGAPGPTLLVTQHRRAFGFPVLYQTKLNRTLADELTERLIHNESDSVVTLIRSRIAHHDWEQSQNLRDFWFECYDAIQAAGLDSIDHRRGRPDGFVALENRP